MRYGDLTMCRTYFIMYGDYVTESGVCKTVKALPITLLALPPRLA